MEVDVPFPPGKQLVSTSQGNAFDRPPDQWIPDELKKFGVIGKPIGPIIALKIAPTSPLLYEVRGSLRDIRGIKGLVDLRFQFKSL